MTASSEITTLRNWYFTGAYQLLLNKVSQMDNLQTPEFQLEKQLLTFRAQIALGDYNIINVIGNNDLVEFRTLVLLAKYFSKSHPTNVLLSQLDQLIKESGGMGKNPYVSVFAAQFYYNEGLLEDALHAVSFAQTLECLSLKIQILLKLNRLDLARKEVDTLKLKSDDSALSQLIEAWVDLYTGGQEKYQEAFFIFEELAANYSGFSTQKLLVGQAICKMHSLLFSEAEVLLVDSMNKNSKDADSMINLLICGIATNKSPDIINQYKRLITDTCPNHAFVQELKAKESLFDKAALKFH